MKNLLLALHKLACDELARKPNTTALETVLPKVRRPKDEGRGPFRDFPCASWLSLRLGYGYILLKVVIYRSSNEFFERFQSTSDGGVPISNRNEITISYLFLEVRTIVHETDS